MTGKISSLRGAQRRGNLTVLNIGFKSTHGQRMLTCLVVLFMMG
jgi:hypothetical protein